MRHLSWNCLGSRCPRSFLYHRSITQMSALQQWENWRDRASLLSMFQLVLTQDVSLNRWIIPQRQDEIGRLQFAAEGHEDNVDLFFTRDLGDMWLSRPTSLHIFPHSSLTEGDQSPENLNSATLLNIQQIYNSQSNWSLGLPIGVFPFLLEFEWHKGIWMLQCKATWKCMQNCKMMVLDGLIFFYICAILKWIIRSKDPSVQISCPQDRVAKVQKQLKALEQWRCSAHLSACWSFFYILIVIWESSQWKAWYIYIYTEYNIIQYIYIYIHIMTIRTWTFISMGMFCVFQQCMLPVVQIWGRCTR